jgi:hypothetical protein
MECAKRKDEVSGYLSIILGEKCFEKHRVSKNGGKCCSDKTDT